MATDDDLPPGHVVLATSDDPHVPYRVVASVAVLDQLSIGFEWRREGRWEIEDRVTLKRTEAQALFKLLQDLGYG